MWLRVWHAVLSSCLDMSANQGLDKATCPLPAKVFNIPSKDFIRGGVLLGVHRVPSPLGLGGIGRDCRTARCFLWACGMLRVSSSVCAMFPGSPSYA